MILSNLGPQILGIVLVAVSQEISEDDIAKGIFYAGLFVAVGNIFVFILLLTNQYNIISDYMIHLGLTTYIDYTDSFFVRPSGYFFDVHSQYFLPLISLTLLKGYDLVKSKPKKLLFNILIISAILVSGVKQGYLTLLVLVLFWFLNSLQSLKSYLNLLFLFIVILTIDTFIGNNISKLWSRIWTHDIEILIEHILNVPILLYAEYPSVFLFGGQPNLAKFIYSEVYYVQLIYYIGVIGLILFYLLPIGTLMVSKQKETVKSIVLIFALSLVHYSVFKIGVNVVGAALVFYFLYKSLFRLEENKWSN